MNPTTLREIDYPESDGKPMAETPLHMLVMWNTIQTLIDWYADDPKVYVWGNMMHYYVEGDIKKTVAPDVFVVKGIDKHRESQSFQDLGGKIPEIGDRGDLARRARKTSAARKISIRTI